MCSKLATYNTYLKDKHATWECLNTQISIPCSLFKTFQVWLWNMQSSLDAFVTPVPKMPYEEDFKKIEEPFTSL